MNFLRKLFRSRRPSAPSFRPAVEGLEERQALSGSSLSPQQSLVRHRVPTGHFHIRVPTNLQRILNGQHIVRGSSPNYLNMAPQVPAPSRLPLNRPVRVIPVPYGNSWAPDASMNGNYSGYGTGGVNDTVGYDDNAFQREVAFLFNPFLGW